MRIYRVDDNNLRANGEAIRKQSESRPGLRTIDGAINTGAGACVNYLCLVASDGYGKYIRIERHSPVDKFPGLAEIGGLIGQPPRAYVERATIFRINGH